MASLVRRSNQFSRFYTLAIRQHKFSSCASASLSSLLKTDFVSSSSSTNNTFTPTCPFHSSPCRCFSSSSYSNKPSTPTCPFHSTSPCRCFSSSSAISVKKKQPVSDVKLSQVIQSEIQCAVEEKDDLDQLTLGMPIRLMDPISEGGLLPDEFPFEVIDTPGEQTITLKRELNGESIEVVVHIAGIGENDIDKDEEDDNDDDDKNAVQLEIPLVVTVTKGDGPRLEFNCLALSEGIVIDSMLMKGPNGSSKELPYEGPEFTDLDENLQRELHGYLERRGIKNSLQNFLQEYMLNKERKEYVNWLKNMKEFVEK
ncbi:Mitochondrial acidic protein mam33 [Thalictrum thalictroides]|uniref:Mitochondrial acidic protein mam33 n=1 Tax=Thalictrum thalictroides TaxID=46969 RepID=A0A7J6VTW9_THATH|nr:Mitochondrial acidic protein mam33 [Thalictrum thalictroides]